MAGMLELLHETREQITKACASLDSFLLGHFNIYSCPLKFVELSPYTEMCIDVNRLFPEVVWVWIMNGRNAVIIAWDVGIDS